MASPAITFVLLVVLASLQTPVGSNNGGDRDTRNKLQIGIKKRVENCSIRSKKGDFLQMHYKVSNSKQKKKKCNVLMNCFEYLSPTGSIRERWRIRQQLCAGTASNFHFRIGPSNQRMGSRTNWVNVVINKCHWSINCLSVLMPACV